MTLRRFLLTWATPARRASCARCGSTDGRPRPSWARTAGETLDLLKVAYDDGPRRPVAEQHADGRPRPHLLRQARHRRASTSITNQPWHERWHAEVLPTYQVARPSTCGAPPVWPLGRCRARAQASALAEGLDPWVNLPTCLPCPPCRDRHVPRRPCPRSAAHRRLPRRPPRGLRVGRRRRAPGRCWPTAGSTSPAPSTSSRPLLADAGWRVVAWDQRGHGDSEHAAMYSWEADLRDALAVVDSITQGPLPVVGHSKGGAVMVQFAAALPHRVSALVNLDGAASGRLDARRARPRAHQAASPASWRAGSTSGDRSPPSRAAPTRSTGSPPAGR